MCRLQTKQCLLRNSLSVTDKFKLSTNKFLPSAEVSSRAPPPRFKLLLSLRLLLLALPLLLAVSLSR